jgi:hypothetical protein
MNSCCNASRPSKKTFQHNLHATALPQQRRFHFLITGVPSPLFCSRDSVCNLPPLPTLPLITYLKREKIRTQGLCLLKEIRFGKADWKKMTRKHKNTGEIYTFKYK